jgi:hypothetical protein
VVTVSPSTGVYKSTPIGGASRGGAGEAEAADNPQHKTVNNGNNQQVRSACIVRFKWLFLLYLKQTHISRRKRKAKLPCDACTSHFPFPVFPKITNVKFSMTNFQFIGPLPLILSINTTVTSPPSFDIPPFDANLTHERLSRLQGRQQPSPRRSNSDAAIGVQNPCWSADYPVRSAQANQKTCPQK